MTQRPNIIYLHSHDTGRYVRPYGHAVDTPNIQRLAEGGVLFRRAFCAAPTCSPSRAALLTGQSPHSAGMLGLAHRGFALHDMNQHLIHTLKGAGYHTALSGVQHVAKSADLIGFNEVHSIKERNVAAVIPDAVSFIQRQSQGAAAERPFFLDVGFFETHRVFPTAESGDDRYVRVPPPFPDTPETRADMADYHASVRELDRGVGAILDALEAAGLAKNTLVINTTDHGLAFPAMKCNLTDHGIGVSLMMRGPKPFQGGVVSDALISHIDLFPTLCDLLDIPKPDWLQGRSFLPVLNGETSAVNDAIFAEVTYHAAYEPQRAVRTDRWKYIRRFGERTIPVLPNCDDGASRDLWLSHGWADRVIPSEQLYDLIFDPNEANNLAEQFEHADTLTTMRDRLDSWMRSTDDPLLQGDVPLPPGASANDPDSRSFSEDLLVASTDGTINRQPNPRTLG